MFWTRAILWKIIKVLGYLIGMVRYFPARKKNYFFCPILDTSTCMQAYLLYQYANSGMNPKTLQYLMGHSDISVTLNIYTHTGYDDAKKELARLKEARDELEKKKFVTQKHAQITHVSLIS